MLALGKAYAASHVTEQPAQREHAVLIADRNANQRGEKSRPRDTFPVIAGPTLRCPRVHRVSRVRHRPGGRSNAPDLVPRMIRVALQNRERPVNLLQQNHSRQFMRQRHPSE
jgi:hypothetical protein